MDVCFCDETFEASSIGPPLKYGVLYYPLRPFTIIKVCRVVGTLLKLGRVRMYTPLVSPSPHHPTNPYNSKGRGGWGYHLKLELLGIRFLGSVVLLEFGCTRVHSARFA